MQGFELYRGPSMIDHEPIVAIATGLQTPSSNAKTGPMVQIYILRSDMHPMEAVQSGKDHAICGSCVHRGRVETDSGGKRRSVGRSCYVTVIHGPRIVYNAWSKGLYPPLTPDQAATALRGRKVRVGAYGDPGAVPVAVWERSLRKVRELTGYTHQWRQFPGLSEFCMASCDTPAERDDAKALGFRTFRVRSRDEPLMTGEGHCPASAEMDHATTCNACLLCGGTRTKAKADITLLVHGTGSRNFNPSQASLALA